MFVWETNLDEESRVRKNIANLQELEQGDLAYDRQLGVAPGWIDKPADKYNAQMLSETMDMLNEKEPRARTKLEYPEEGQDLEVTIELV